MADTPQYPNFKKIELSDKSVFDQFNRFPPYSDFNLLSLLSWNMNGSNSFSILNNNLVLRFKDYLTDGQNYSVLGDSQINETLSVLLTSHNKLSMVPEAVINNIEVKDKFSIEEDRDNFDYIVSTEQLSKMEGGKLKPLRRSINKFKREYPEYVIKKLDPKADYEAILDLTKDWVNERKMDSGKLEEEVEILNSFISNSEYFDCTLLGLYINNALIAFTFNEVLPTKILMGHFGKANNAYSGASYVMEYETSKYFLDKGVLILNHQQDAGLTGLRAAKLSYEPIYFLKKYTIALK